MKKIVAILFLAMLSANSYSQQKPKLVVGIVVDQMRQEYLYRFDSKFSEGGFKRLVGSGYMLKNAHYNYVPTYTGPGHASIYSGTTPAVHGIIGNDWWDKNAKKSVNCVEDERYKAVGNPEGNGDVSPWRLLSTTITDELKLFTQKRAKVIGISMKDRGAVLPAGHMANAAYWYDSKTGKFISSTYYLNALPSWVDSFNSQKLADNYLNQTWNTLLPIAQYTESGPDESPYERKLQGAKAVFPYNLKDLRKANGDYELLVNSAMGDDLLTEFAKATLNGEQLGKDNDTDFLTISYSTPDYIGHGTGPNSVEVEDTYLRLDRNIEDLLKKLDQEVGKGEYVVFLTADHAVADVPQSLKDIKIPAGNFPVANVEAGLNDHLQKYFPGKKVIERMSNDQVFLNQELFAGDPKSSGIDLLIATELITNYLQATDGVAQVYPKAIVKQGSYSEGGTKGMIIRGYNFKRSGDIIYQLEPGWITGGSPQGTTHGSSYTYDTHVPILFYGAGIKKGSSSQYHTITDIAPTLSVLLQIKFPSGCTGQPVSEMLD
ncbi:MAG: alkaline phosphatase family protein [Bacteroidetes bacterium]|nr:alkaline phosphatase family protein [Bacteroidota bacterium]